MLRISLYINAYEPPEGEVWSDRVYKLAEVAWHQADAAPYLELTNYGAAMDRHALHGRSAALTGIAALATSGYGVTIDTNHQTWAFYYSQEDDLLLDMRHGGAGDGVTVTTVRPVIPTASIYKADGPLRFSTAPFLFLQHPVDHIVTEFGAILVEPRHANGVFVGGVRLCDAADIEPPSLSVGYDLDGAGLSVCGMKLTEPTEYLDRVVRIWDRALLGTRAAEALRLIQPLIARLAVAEASHAEQRAAIECAIDGALHGPGGFRGTEHFMLGKLRVMPAGSVIIAFTRSLFHADAVFLSAFGSDDARRFFWERPAVYVAGHVLKLFKTAGELEDFAGMRTAALRRMAVLPPSELTAAQRVTLATVRKLAEHMMVDREEIIVVDPHTDFMDVEYVDGPDVYVINKRALDDATRAHDVEGCIGQPCVCAALHLVRRMRRLVAEHMGDAVRTRRELAMVRAAAAVVEAA